MTDNYVKDTPEIKAFVEQHGVPCTVKPYPRSFVKRMKPGHCFRNALSIAYHCPNKYLYYEGIAYPLNINENSDAAPFIHAWNRLLFPNDQVRIRQCGPFYIDTTLSIPALCSIGFNVGIPFNTEFACHAIDMQTAEGKTCMSVLTYEPLLRGEIPEKEWKYKDAI